MATGDAVRKAMGIAMKSFDAHETKPFKSSLLTEPNQEDPKKKAASIIAFETRLITSFHHGDSVQNQIDIARFILAYSGCQSVVILRIIENYESGLFRMYFRGETPCSTTETYAIDDFRCVQTVMNKREEVIDSDEDFQALSVLVEWKPLFKFIPDVVVAVPIFQLDQQITSIIAISFKKKLPSDFMTQKFPVIKGILENVTPYAMMLQASRDYAEDGKKMQIVINALETISREKNRRSPEACVSSIAMELSRITSCYAASIYQLDTADKHFLRVYTTAASQKKAKGDRTCPNPLCHENDRFPYSSEMEPLGWVAVNRKILKINDASECADYNLTRRALHSSLSCACRNVLCVPLNDHTGERNIVIELTDKPGGFTLRDVELGDLLCQSASSIYSCAILLNHRDKTYRRNSMMSKILLNSDPIKHTKVEQVLSQLRKITPAEEFGGDFLKFSFSVKNFPDWKMAGWILHAFHDLDLMSIFKIRSTTLIRFIVAAQQGYRDLPYHNWQHACSVAHFGYCLIKNLKLLEDDYMTPLEAFALIVSGLVHDIDHRGTNNRFQSCTNSDLFQLYNTLESVLERHHLAIALSILRREDCNILENLSAEDYKEFIELLTWNILATDIAKYLQSRELNFSLLRNLGEKNKREDKLALFSLMMTASDVSDCVKNWDVNLESVIHILTEFFSQGDLEKTMGMSPMPMMDRTVAYIPEVEHKFISGIVLPVFREFATRFPCMKPEQEILERSKENWEFSTVIFDSHNEVEDPLSILSLPEMSEYNLRKIGADNPNIRRLSFEQTVITPRKTLAMMNRTFESRPSQVIRSSLAIRPSLIAEPHQGIRPSLAIRRSIRHSIRPEEEFRMMFSDKTTDDVDVQDFDEIEKEIYLIEDEVASCWCFKKKKSRKSKKST